MKKFLAALVLMFLPAASAYAVYCGTFSVSGTGGTGSGGVAAACTYYVAASGGNDSNSGTTSATPFATLAHAQAAMRNIVAQSQRVTCLKAGSGGTYNLTSSITLTSADSGETWQYDPASGVNTATLDCGGTCDHFVLNHDGLNNVTINGIKMLHGNDGAIYDGSGGTVLNNITVENCELAFNNQTGSTGGFNPELTFGNGTNIHILHNYVHDTVSQGIGMFAFNAGDTLNGLVIDGNVVLNAVTSHWDGGAIYVDMRSSMDAGGAITISNNFVRDYGNNGVQGEGIYLDDDTSHATVTGNVVGPPNPSLNTNGNFQALTLINGGDNNTFQNNIFDLGPFGIDQGNWLNGMSNNAGSGSAIGFNWTGPNQFVNNIVVSGYTGAVTARDGVIYDEASGTPTNDIIIGNNLYHNYNGGPENTSGTLVSDSSPVHADPACSGYLYTLATNSAAFNAPISFKPLVTGWGPPGFVIPTSTNHSCP